jgi:hypothetical protein
MLSNQNNLMNANKPKLEDVVVAKELEKVIEGDESDESKDSSTI